MAVISVSITESSEQIVAGIPRFVSIETNVASSIFYSLDGTDPTLYSSIYTGPIYLPTNLLTLTLKVYATNGLDSSSIITNNYYATGNAGENVRLPHAATNAPPNSSQGLINPFPFGSPPIYPNQKFIGTAESGINVNDPLQPQISTGFGADGYPTGFTNGQDDGIPSQNFLPIYSETDAIGQVGPGIGTLPKHTIERKISPPEQSNIGSPLFDPRALVIFQDLTVPQDESIPPHINRMAFTIENLDNARYGAAYKTYGIDSPPVMGSFVRQHYNPADNTMTYYYFDNMESRWIISKTPYTPKADQFNYASKMVSPIRGGNGANKVFAWRLWKSSYLY